MYTAKGVAALLVPLGNILTHATGSWHAVYTVGCLMNVAAALLGFFVLRPAINARLKRAGELATATPTSVEAPRTKLATGAR
jgi:MFS transporter, OFA family, oxalate/formate antiporter